MPSKTLHHKIESLSRFIESNGEAFAREYGEYFQKEVKEFERKLEAVKHEIQLSLLVEKSGKGEPLSGTKIDFSTRSHRESESGTINENKRIEQDSKFLEDLRHPSAKKLSDMGVNYKPTIRHRMLSGESNILKSPKIDQVMSQVDSNRISHNNRSPASPNVHIKILDSSEPMRVKSKELFG